MTANVQEVASQGSDLPLVGMQVGEIKTGRNYSLVRLGGVQDLARYRVKHPLAPVPVSGKVFLKEPLRLTGMEISFGVLPAHAALPFMHKHRVNEEVYLFVRGRGQIRIDGDVLDVEEGTAVRVSPEGVRTWRNNSAEDLIYIVVQAKQGSLTAWTLTDGVDVPGKVEWPEPA